MAAFSFGISLVYSFLVADKLITDTGSQADSKFSDYLILGGTGFLGSEFVKSLAKSNSVEATYHKKLPFEFAEVKWHKFDAIDFDAQIELINRIRPKVVINCIALTDVELCESLPILATDLNRNFPRSLACICAQLATYLIHISTDHYESHVRRPRKENDYMFGINQYGISKLQGEIAIQEENSASLILRTNFFGYSNSESKSFLNWIIKNLESNIKIQGFINVDFTPVSIPELIKCALDLKDINFSGIVNVASNESITKYDFIRLVAKVFGLNTDLIEPEISDTIKGRVKRPNYMALDNSRLSAVLKREINSIESMIEQVQIGKNGKT
jgi:dTDP-4-dehydrorhamnose reductase